MFSKPQSNPSKSPIRPSSVPESLLSGDNCTDSSRIRAFLRLSRISTDDSIKTHLNEINSSQCDSYFRDIIVPEWNTRASVIQFCKNHSHKLKQEIEQTGARPSSDSSSDSNGNREFDLRLDPYAMKEFEQSKEAKYSKINTIDNWVENEDMVESIVKEQTQNAFNDRCYYKNWLTYFDQLTKDSTK